MSDSSQETRASGKLAAMFFARKRGTRKHNQEFYFQKKKKKNANPSNLGRSLLEGNKDHLLGQARSDLMKQELQVESLNNCISELQQQV